MDWPATNSETIRHTARQTTQALLQAGRRAETVLHVVNNAYQQVTSLVEQSPKRPDHACAAGCCFCCYLPVDVTAPEALSIVAYLRTTLSPEAYAAMCAHMAATAAKVSGLSFEAHAQAKIPCALLVDGTCSVYLRRPFACRAWNSTSAARCEEIFHGDPVTMIPPIDTCAYEAAWDVARGTAEGLRPARLDGNTYELHSILRRALETPEALQRWLQGEDIFAGCTLGAFTG